MTSLPARWIAVAAVGLLLLGGAIVLNERYHPFGSPPFDPAGLSSTERAQLSDLMLSVAEAPQETLPDARDRVWTILRSHGAEPVAVRRGLEPIFLKIGQGPKLFWTDAQRAITERRPIKSAARTQWEAELMGKGWLTLVQQRRYDDFMERIVRGEPIESSHGVEIAVDDRMIRAITNSLDDAELRGTVVELLTPPARSSSHQ